MSDVTNHYVVRAKRETEEQYESLRSALSKTIQHKGWMVEQMSVITGVLSLNDAELKKTWNISRFPMPETIRSKLVMEIFDEYANILKGVYGIRLNGRSDHGGTPTRPTLRTTSPLINSFTT